MNLLSYSLNVLLILSSLALTGACASTDDRRLGTEPEGAYANSQADPSAYGADGFTFNKYQKRREQNDFMFYFKHCTQADSRSYYSRTSYWCSDP